MKTITTYIMISLLGCHAPTTKHNGRPDSIQHPSVVETKTDSTVIEYPPYKPFKEFKGDTLVYLKTNFLDRMGYYQNKPLALLLKDLEIHIFRHHTYQPYYPPFAEFPYGIYLDFGKNFRKRELKQTPNKLVIGVKDTIDIEKIRPIMRRSQFRWTKEVETLYGKMIVNNIDTISISKPDPNYKITERLRGH